MDFIWQPAMTSSVVGLRRNSKALSKAKPVPNNVTVTVWWSAGVWPTTAFWILAKPLHLRSMLSKPMRRTENCNACSRHWSTECTQFFSMTTPSCTLHNQHVKRWTNWAAKFCLICHIHRSFANHLPLLQAYQQHFCRETASTTSRRQKMLSKNSSNPEAWIFTLQK